MNRMIVRKLAVFMTFCWLPSAAFAGTLEGEILGLEPQGPGAWKLTVRADGQEQSLVLSARTQIQKSIAIEDVRQGDRIIRKTGGGGTQGFKAPFENLSKGAKKMLGLPDVPSVPQVPQVPQIPDKQQMQGSPAPGGGGTPPAGGAPAPGPGKAPPKEEEPVKTQGELLEEKGFQNEKLLFPASAGEAAAPGSEVTQIKKTDQGFEVTLVSAAGEPEKETYSPGKKVLKALDPKDLNKKDLVRLDYSDENQMIVLVEVQA